MNYVPHFQASRSESVAIDEGRAKEDAKALYKAGEKKMGTDEETFNRILCCRSYRQLRATFREYYQVFVLINAKKHTD